MYNGIIQQKLWKYIFQVLLPHAKTYSILFPYLSRISRLVVVAHTVLFRDALKWFNFEDSGCSSDKRSLPLSRNEIAFQFKYLINCRLLESGRREMAIEMTIRVITNLFNKAFLSNWMTPFLYSVLDIAARCWGLRKLKSKL